MTTVIKSATTLLFVFAVAMATSARAQTDAISNYFSQYVDDPDFTVVYISGKMFDLVDNVISSVETDDFNAEQSAALSEVVQGMRGLRILTTDVDGMARYTEAKQKMLGARPYELLMTVREKQKNNVDFYTHSVAGGDKVDELLLLVGQEEGTFVLLSLVGNVDMEKIGELAKSFEDEDEDEGDRGDRGDEGEADEDDEFNDGRD